MANIALHGLEEAAKASIESSNIPNKATEANRCQVITYADDLIIMVKSYIALEKAIESVKMELEQIGLNFSIFKSRVTTSSFNEKKHRSSFRKNPKTGKKKCRF